MNESISPVTAELPVDCTYHLIINAGYNSNNEALRGEEARTHSESYNFKALPIRLRVQ